MPRVAEVALLFLRLGATTFGGPAAHIARMEEEIVRRRGWLSHDELLDLVGAANLVPGPNSTEVAIHVGYKRAGWLGLVAAGVAFIAPAALATTALAWGYVTYGSLPQVAGMLRGVKPVIVAIVADAMWRFARTAAKDTRLGVIGFVSAIAVALGVAELAVLAASGGVAMLTRARGKGVRAGDGALLVASAPLSAAAAAGSASIGGLFLMFLKIGAVLFGSGYVLLAFLRADLVERRGWLTEGQLLDAVAAGQITPGPLFTTATFVGYLLHGGAGAAVATVGIFLPAFVFVALSGPLVPRLRKSAAAGAFLDGVNVASVALMVVVTVALAREAFVDPVTIAMGVASLVVLATRISKRVSSVWLVAAGAAVGWMRA